METQYASKYHKVEESHWWFLGRRDIIYQLMKDYQRNTYILDIGCSGCALITFLKERGFANIQGIDLNRDAITLCKQKGISDVHVARAEKTGYPDQQFDILIASDILEHIQDDDMAIAEWKRILKKDGRLILFVPAFRFLWSFHDEVNHHHRRYSRSGLNGLLKKNGLKIERSSYWNFFLFPLVSAFRLFQKYFSHKSRQKDQLQETNQCTNKILEYLLRVENRLLGAGINFAFGISVFAIARKE